MKKPVGLLLATLLLPVSFLSAQMPHTLLWRISGKNGQKPSYLYGTMHLTSEKVFNLGDSVYEAIRQSDGFAMELDPGALSVLMLDEIKKEVVKKMNVREVLSDKEYKTYGPQLAKKLHKPLAEISTDDVLKEKNKWVRESYRSGKMQTFLDVYLFDIARRQNKWTGGVEDAEDQRGLIDDAVDHSDVRDIVADSAEASAHSALDRMIDIYQRQDLDAVDSFFNVESGGKEDPVMLRRNRKMAGRMDSLAGVRSMVFAVGVAHLTGEHGLIELLRKKGYAVEPVFSDRKIQAADYKVKELPPVWSEVTDEEGWYRASMPGKAGNVQLYGVLNMKVYIDIFNGSGYFTTAARLGYSEEKLDSVIDAVAGKMFNTKDRKGYVAVDLGGAKGRMYTTNNADGFRKGAILIKDGVFYIIMGSAMREDSLNRKNIDQFLASFRALEMKRDTTAVYAFTDSALSFRIATPARYKLYDQESMGKPRAKDWDSRMYICLDPSDGAYYFFGANSVMPGHFIPNDSTLFESLKKNVTANLTSIEQDTVYFSNGHRVVEYRGRMKNTGMIMTVRYIARGNRWYGLVAMRPVAASAERTQQFLHSFSLLDYPAHLWQTYASPDTLFRSWVPSPPSKLEKDSSDNVYTDFKYGSFDSSRSNNYSIIGYHLNPYYWSVSDSAFWAQRIAAHTGYSDILLYKKPVSNGNLKGWEWAKKERSSTLVQRHRELLDGNQLYDLLVCGSPEDIQSPNTSRFFEDFRLTAMPARPGYLDSRADTLLRALFSTDSATVSGALAYLDYAPFGKKDLSLLYHALLGKARVNNNRIDPGSVNNRITQRIEVLRDSSSFRFAAGAYPQSPDSPRFLRDNLIEIMAQQQDKAHLTEMADLLRGMPPHGLPYSFVKAMKDSLSLTAQVMPGLLPLLADSLSIPAIANLASMLIDSSLLSIRDVLPWQGNIQRYALARVHYILGQPEESDVHDMKLAALLGDLNNPRCNALLRKFFMVKDKYIQVAALGALLRNGQQPDPAICLALAADKGSRLNFYRALDKAGKRSLFPAAYRTQQLFGESEVVEQAAEDDEGEVISIVFLTTKLSDTDKGKKRFFFYKIKPGGSDDFFLACAGPYDLDPGKMNISEASAVIDYEKSYDGLHAAEQMDALLERIKAIP